MDKTLSRHRWITAGLQALAEEGPQCLRIMTIADRMNVTKGSFYWHFESLEHYHRALLEEWEHLYTQEAISWVEGHSSDPHERLDTWIRGAAYADARLDRALRAWSLGNEMVREVRERVDEQRTAYLIRMLRDVGWSKQDAKHLGSWTYWAWIGHASLGEGPVSEAQLAFILGLLREPGASGQ